MYQKYVVERGDTLYGISNQFGVSVDDIIKANNLKSTLITVGETLNIPNKEGTNPDNIIIYTVKKGDSLYGIAKKYNTTVNEIARINNLKNYNLQINQKLKIPERYSVNNTEGLPNYTNYTVKKGDTLYSIAKNYNTTVDEIIRDNSLNTNVLNIGQNLKIRTKSSDILECFGEDYSPPSNNNYITYVVKKGDSLYKIAKKYNTSVQSIINKNNLKSNILSIGQKLYI